MYPKYRPIWNETHLKHHRPQKENTVSIEEAMRFRAFKIEFSEEIRKATVVKISKT